MPLKLPRRLARFNRVVTNPIQGVYAWLLPPWAVICHRGRRTARAYRTPVLAVKRGDTVAVAVLYGEESDWVRNLLAAGGGQLVRAGRTYELAAPRLVHAGGRDPAVAGAGGCDAAVTGGGGDPASAAARPLLRLADTVLVAQLRGPARGFGPGPGAGPGGEGGRLSRGRGPGAGPEGRAGRRSRGRRPGAGPEGRAGRRSRGRRPSLGE